MATSWDLRGRHAVVTGGAQRIAGAIVGRFVDNGARLGACCLLACAIAVAAAPVRADDAIRIRELPPHPPPSRSVGFVNVEIRRVEAPAPHDDAPIDRYFDAVRRALADGAVPARWSRAVPDAAYVELDISLRDAHYTLVHTFGAVDNDDERRIEQAIGRILALTSDYVAQQPR
jgi:NAD(P)-dependent dehydrogenase (short-subunit alcohol dehydrogenase family)